jgi:hypothetical protein
MKFMMQVHALSVAGYKEITLLGQNVNSYRYNPVQDVDSMKQQQQQQQQQQHGVMSKGFSTIYKPPPAAVYDFADLVHAGFLPKPQIRTQIVLLLHNFPPPETAKVPHASSKTYLNP